MDFLSNEEGYLRASTYLNSVAGKFGLTREQMTRMKPTPSELYVNSVLSAGGTAHLLTLCYKRYYYPLWRSCS